MGRVAMGSLIIKRPLGLRTRNASVRARCKSVGLKILNKQFWATTSTEASGTGRSKASPARISTKFGSNQSFS